MDGLLIGTTIALCGLTVCGASLLTYLARWLAPRLGFVDCPDGRRKRHQQPMPLLGGVAVFGGILLTTLGGWLAGGLEILDPSTRLFLIWSLSTATLFCLIGVCDDRWPLRPRTKFLLQVLACIPFALWGRTATELEILGLNLTLGAWSVPFTVLWLVACVNAFNLLDGLDGQATSLGIISCLAFAGLATLRGDFATTVLALLIVGNLIGFLWHNKPPARIFLGDAGSLTIGFLAGTLSLETALSTEGSFACVLPCVVLGLPLFDTSMAIIRRKLNGRGIGEADREHIHHCLQDQGFSRVRSLLIVVVCGLIQTAFVLAAAVIHQELLGVLGLALTLGCLVAFRWFGHREVGLITLRVQDLLARNQPLRPRRFNPLEWLAF